MRRQSTIRILYIHPEFRIRFILFLLKGVCPCTASTASISTTFDYFNRSASFGNSKAHQILGLIHSMGLLSQPQSEVLSLLHYHFAASGGQSQAAMALGFRYLHGVGVSKNCSRVLILLGEFYFIQNILLLFRDTKQSKVF